MPQRYHWSVEYFEDLRNVNHCEFIIMKQNLDNGKYVLKNQLRTWSDLKRRAALASDAKPATPTTPNATHSYSTPTRKWGGCAQGCNHGKFDFHRKPRRQNTQDFIQQPAIAPPAASNEVEDHPIASQEADKVVAGLNGNAIPRKKGTAGGKSVITGTKYSRTDSAAGGDSAEAQTLVDHAATTTNEETDEAAEDTPYAPSQTSEESEQLEGAASIPAEHYHLEPQIPHRPSSRSLVMGQGRDFGGSESGMGSPNDVSDDSDYFDTNVHQLSSRMASSTLIITATAPRSQASRSLLAQLDGAGDTLSSSSSTTLERRSSSRSKGRASSNNGRKNNGRKGSTSSKTEKEWMEESGMNGASKADALGDVNEDIDVDGKLDDLNEDEVEGMKERDRKTFDEIY
jgi:hypothetical protein